MPNFAYFRTQNGKTFKKDASEMHALCRQMIRERMDANAVEDENYLQNKVDSGERLDFLDICLSSTDADGNPISEDEILAQTVTFVAAGFGTTTSAVSFVLHLLAKNKDAQQRCHEEAVELLSDGQVNLNLLSKLKYINMCFKEGTWPCGDGGASRTTSSNQVVPRNADAMECAPCLSRVPPGGVCRGLSAPKTVRFRDPNFPASWWHRSRPPGSQGDQRRHGRRRHHRDPVDLRHSSQPGSLARAGEV